MKNYKSIFVYDKDGDLTSYAEIDKNDNSVVNQYFVKGKELTKSNIFTYGKKKEKTDTKILYDEECALFFINLDGESFCRVTKKKSHSISPPNEISRISISDEKKAELFTIKKNLVEDWIKLL